MKKYYDIDHDKVYTEDELRIDYETRKRNGEIDAEIYSDFEYYLSACMTENNGSLEEIAPDWMINRLRRSVANDISCADISYEQALDVLQKYNVFGTWTVYEINNRPVNVDELAEIVEEYM